MVRQREALKLDQVTRKKAGKGKQQKIKCIHRKQMIKWHVEFITYQ